MSDTKSLLSLSSDDESSYSSSRLPSSSSSSSASSTPTTHGSTVEKQPSSSSSSSSSHQLGEWCSTALSGNDLTSSIFYACGLCIVDAGVYAPLCMCLVSLTLYLFRFVYGEAVTALPFNGGLYNVLLNSTRRKSVAAVAACLMILAYVATAVVSAADAIHYAQHLWSSIPLSIFVLLVLLLFAVLCLVGVRESGWAALFIFSIHLSLLSLLIILSLVYVFTTQHKLWLYENFASPAQPSLSRALFYGFSSAMLGVTGFETAANFIEQQKHGVYIRVLRNMWLLVTFINPIIAFFTLCVADIRLLTTTHANDAVAVLASTVAGSWLDVVISVDAVLVLSGSVLTAYVGVNGLLMRLALDRCLPSTFLSLNSVTHTPHWIILSFFVLTSSIYLIAHGSIHILSNIYSLAFLSVLLLFAVANLRLKLVHPQLPRAVTASPFTVLLAIFLSSIAWVGNILKDPAILPLTLLYYVVTVLVVATAFHRVFLVKILTKLAKQTLGPDSLITQTLSSELASIRSSGVCYLCKHASLFTLNRVVLYLMENEDTNTVHFCHMFTPPPSTASATNKAFIRKQVSQSSASPSSSPPSSLPAADIPSDGQQHESHQVKLRFDDAGIEGGSSGDSDSDSVGVGSSEEMEHALNAIVDTLRVEYPNLIFNVMVMDTSLNRDSIDQLASDLNLSKNLVFITPPRSGVKDLVASLGGVRIISI